MDIPPQQKKSECDIDYCLGEAEEASFPCEVCEAAIGSSLNTLSVAMMRFFVCLCVALLPWKGRG
jgi:hypothetical protein